MVANDVQYHIPKQGVYEFFVAGGDRIIRHREGSPTATYEKNGTVPHRGKPLPYDPIDKMIAECTGEQMLGTQRIVEISGSPFMDIVLGWVERIKEEAKRPSHQP